MLKEELRALYLQKRQDLTKLEKKNFHNNIKDHFVKFLKDSIKCIHIYLPIQQKIEIDTWPIIHTLWESNIHVVVPKMQPSENKIHSYYLSRETKLNLNKWGVPEPIVGKEITIDEIDAVVVPLLAYDRIGNRVGYGKGYYDIFLKTINKKTIKIGLSFFSPVEKISNPDPWDVKLDYCITPEKILKF